jgi:hypothetical protein
MHREWTALNAAHPPTGLFSTIEALTLRTWEHLPPYRGDRRSLLRRTAAAVHATAPRAAEFTILTQCSYATPYVGTVSSQRSARPATVHAQHTQHRHERPRPWALCPTLVTQGLHFFASWNTVFRCMSDTVLAALKAWGMAASHLLRLASHLLRLASHVTQIVADIRQRSRFRSALGDDAPARYGTTAYALVALVQLREAAMCIICVPNSVRTGQPLVNTERGLNQDHVVHSDNLRIIAHRVHNGISDTQYL